MELDPLSQNCHERDDTDMTIVRGVFLVSQTTVVVLLGCQRGYFGDSIEMVADDHVSLRTTSMAAFDVGQSDWHTLGAAADDDERRRNRTRADLADESARIADCVGSIV